MNTASLKQEYRERIVPALMKEFAYTSVMQVPKWKNSFKPGLGNCRCR
jgi:large subunit ribosomal protein L5